MKVEMVPSASLKPPSWASSYLLRPDKLLLRLSMIESGWLQPIVVRLADQTIIDGVKRWDFACTDEKFQSRHGAFVPVVYHDVDEIDAMILHIRLNRARGNTHPVGMSTMLKKIVYSGKYEADELSNILVMSDDEIDLLLSSGLLKKKNWEKYEYSRAWVPIEVPKGTEVETSFIERPPNADR